MVTIKEALGNKFKKIILKNNESIHGGTVEHNETLGTFMEYANLTKDDDYGELCKSLEQCGIKAIRPLNYIDLNGNKTPNRTKIKADGTIDTLYVLKNYNKKRFEEKTFKEILEEDMEYCKKLLKENIRLIHYDKDAQAWFINETEIVDELWYEYNTTINPKELIGYIEEFIEDELKISKNRCIADIQEEYYDNLIRDTLPDDELIYFD